MTFLAAGRLWLLLLVAALAAAYIVIQQRRPRYAVRFTNLDLLATVAPHRPGWRRHVPAALMALAVAVLVMGLARPARDERVPKEEAVVMLVIDTSISMAATDVEPDRLSAATEAGRTFVAGLPEKLSVGLVSFDGSTRVVTPPTLDHAAVGDALAQLVTGPGTAAGDAIYTALDAIAVAGGPSGAGVAGEPAEGEQTAAIVLLSDGVTTVGRSVEQASAAAAERGVPVSTIAFGTDEGTVTVQGETVGVPADPETMAGVAEATDGRFFEAASVGELREVYDDIASRVGFDTVKRDVSLSFVAAAVVVLIVALGAALVWTSRVL